MTNNPTAVSAAAWSDERSFAVYRDSVRDAFSFLKRTSRLDELLAKSIPLAGDRGWLAPLSDLHADDEAVIAMLTEWRIAHEYAFPTRFEVTVAGTARWLAEQVLAKEDRMLFLVTDRHGRPLGHLGFADALSESRVMHVDNVVRGVAGVEPGIMSDAMAALIRWANEVLWPEGFELSVLRSNGRAVDFYATLGFVASGETPLKWVAVDGGKRLEPAQDGDEPDDAYITMRYAPSPRVEFEDTILTSGPSISGREVAYALDAARDGWNRNWSLYLDRFEKTFADYIGVEYALATSSCTGALHIALAALDIGPGDEVIVPDLTWVATANAVRYVGATPVFCDIERETMCMDPDKLEACITPRTKAVIPVHLYGHPADVTRIVKIARAAGLYVVEDAAPSIGAECRGEKTGTFGDFAAFSFQGAKLLVTGEGGTLVTNDPELYAKAKKIWDQGRDPNRAFWIDASGLKYKMSNVQAALGLAQMERADAHVEAKRRLHSWYAEALAGIEGVSLCGEAVWARSIHWMNTVHVGDDTGALRDGLRDWLAERKVDTRPVFPAISDYPIWPVRSEGGPVAHSVGARGMNLPSGLWMGRDHVEYVARCIREFMTAQAR